MKLTSRNQAALLEECIVHDREVPEDHIGDVPRLEMLQTHRPQAHLSLSPSGLEYNVGIAVDVHEACVGEHGEKQFDAARMRRRFEDQWTIVLPGQFPVEERQRRSPFSNLSLGDLSKRDRKSVV